MEPVVAYLLDTSTWIKHLHARVGSRVADLVERRELHLCEVVELEFLNAAKNASAWTANRDALAELEPTQMPRSVYRVALELQYALASRQLVGRKVADLLIAATAIETDLTVLHYDTDYEHIASVSSLRHEWVVPRGTI